MTDRDEGTEPEDASGDASPELTRRRLFRHVGAFGVAGAIAWSAPGIRSVRLDQAGAPGSPSPVTTAGNTVPVTAGSTVPTGGGPTGGGPAAGPAVGAGQLPVTGTEAAQLALFGTGAVVLGRALTQAAQDRDGLRDAPTD